MLPYLTEWHLEAEDAIATTQQTPSGAQVLKVVVPAYPRISNHTDFDALRLHPQIDLQMIRSGQPLPDCDLIILPGSKNVRADLTALRAQGWSEAIERHLRYGGKLLGICGGMQMLGNSIADPHGLEGTAGTTTGLGWLAIETVLEPEKQLKRVAGTLCFDNAAVSGYEIHAGVTSGTGLSKPLVNLGERSDGAISADNQIAGTYLHGLFDETAARDALLRWAGLNSLTTFDYNARREVDINRLADSVEKNLDFKIIESLIF